MSSRQDGIGHCEHCGRSFGYMLIHNGFNESVYAYCEACGRTAILDGRRLPTGAHIPLHQAIPADRGDLLQPCICGGRFRGDAGPRCPVCRKALSAQLAASWVEAQAPGTVQGWRWQQNWQGLYCIVIEDQVVYDNWRSRPGAR
jgi:hypothetical protein